MSSGSNNQEMQDKRSNFLDKVQKETGAEEKSPRTAEHSSSSAKPKGTFLEGSGDQPRKPVERRAPPSCGWKGG